MCSRNLKPFARRLRMYRKQHGLCWLCGEHLDLFLPTSTYGGVTFEHVVARAHGGSDCWRNKRLTHYECNQARGHRLTWSMTRPRSLAEAMKSPQRLRKEFFHLVNALRPVLQRADRIEGLS